MLCLIVVIFFFAFLLLQAFLNCKGSLSFTTSNPTGSLAVADIDFPFPSAVSSSGEAVAVSASVDVNTHVFSLGDHQVVFTADLPGQPTCTVDVFVKYGVTYVLHNFLSLYVCVCVCVARATASN